jgi:hypothetical protein
VLPFFSRTFSIALGALPLGAPEALILPGIVQSQTVAVVIDTGATDCWIDGKCCQHLQLPVTPVHPLSVSYGVNNHAIYPKGTCQTSLIVSGESFPLCLKVTDLPEGCDLILGCDWMQSHNVVVDVASKQVLVRAPPGSVSEKTLVWSQTPQIPVPIRTAPSGEGLNSGMPGLPRVGPWPPKRMIAPLPNVLLKSANIPTYLSTALVEQPAQLDIYGRILVDIDHLDLGEQGPHAVPAEDLRALLKRHQDICPSEIPPGIPPERWDLGPFNVIPLQPDSKPQRGHRFRMSPKERAELDKQTAYLLEQGWIRKSTSEWACSCIFAPKGFQGEDGLRVCQDYRRLNSVTVKNRTPIPRIDDLLDAAGGFSICSSLDLASGYHQIPLTEEEIPRSAFYGTNELYEFTVMAFGFTNAPAVFQTAMQKALAGYLGKFVLVYLDDVLVFSKNPGEH